ncbi:MAG: hypothetical protein ACTSYD_00485 [Candidatus Heimdallarchaeaceae archaeon]
MRKSQKQRSNSKSTFYNSLQVVEVTIEKLAQYLSDNLLYQPGFEYRNKVMRQIYENIVNYLDEIRRLAAHKTNRLWTKEEQAISHFKTVVDLLCEVNILLSSERNLQLPIFEIIYSLNQLIQDSVALFVQVLSRPTVSFLPYQINELEMGAKKLYQVALKDQIMDQIGKDTYNFRIYLIIDKMKNIVVNLCEAMIHLLQIEKLKKE